MLELLTDIVLDTLIDFIKLLPFLFATYLGMEWLEHKAGDLTRDMMVRSGRKGPIIGGILGVVPQCGFSAAGATLYAGKVITMGTLFSIFLSTSDEMIPVMLSQSAPVGVMIKVLVCKVVIAIICGMLVDTFIVPVKKSMRLMDINGLCKQEACECETKLLMPAIRHTIHTGGFILLVSFILNLIFGIMGEDVLGNLFQNLPLVGNMTAALIGLIPNCAPSVVLTQLYMSGVLDMGCLVSGLLTGAGIGLLVLFRTNKKTKQNLMIAAGLWIFGAVGGFAIDMIMKILGAL